MNPFIFAPEDLFLVSVYSGDAVFTDVHDAEGDLILSIPGLWREEDRGMIASLLTKGYQMGLSVGQENIKHALRKLMGV